jgi:hypothetical protein
LVANAKYYQKERDYWQAVRNCDWCFGFSDASWPSFREKSLPAARLCVLRDEVSLYELPNACPMAFAEANPQTPLPIEFHGWGAAVDVPGNGPRSVVVNLVVRPWLRAASGTQPLESSSDEWGRMLVRVPDGVSSFRVYYDLPWRRGILLGVFVATATLVGFSIIHRAGILRDGGLCQG